MKTKIFLIGMLFASGMFLTSCGSIDNPLEELVSSGAIASVVADNSLQIDNNTIVPQSEAE